MFNNKQKGASPMLNRKKNNNIKDIENEVNQWRKQNIKKVEINLFPGEKEYLIENLDCKVMPILYEIKEKNIDKDKIEKIADGYKGKSEGELMDELVKIGKTLEGKEQVVSKLNAILNNDHKKKQEALIDKK